MILKKPTVHYLELECELYQSREVLRALLHSVVFHRYFGSRKVQDVDLDVCRVTFSKVMHTALEEKVERTIKAAQRYLELNDTGVHGVEVRVMVGGSEEDSSNSNAAGWLMWQKPAPSGEDAWEEWKINLKIQSNSQLERQLRAALLRIAEMAMEGVGGDERRDVGEGEIRMLVPEVSETLSFGGMFKKLLSEASAMPAFINKN